MYEVEQIHFENEHVEWLAENATGRYQILSTSQERLNISSVKMSPYVIIFFEDEADAVGFRLMFGFGE